MDQLKNKMSTRNVAASLFLDNNPRINGSYARHVCPHGKWPATWYLRTFENHALDIAFWKIFGPKSLLHRKTTGWLFLCVPHAYWSAMKLCKSSKLNAKFLLPSSWAATLVAQYAVLLVYQQTVSMHQVVVVFSNSPVPIEQWKQREPMYALNKCCQRSPCVPSGDIVVVDGAASAVRTSSLLLAESLVSSGALLSSTTMSRSSWSLPESSGQHLHCLCSCIHVLFCHIWLRTEIISCTEYKAVCKQRLIYIYIYTTTYWL